MLRKNRAAGNWLLVMFILVCGLFAGISRADAIAVASGQKIAFLGDSITQFGWQRPGGYVTLVISGLAANGIAASAVPAGVSGNTSRDMIARLDRDVVSKKPDWVTISCGVNDVWHGAAGVELEPYKKNMTDIVDRCQAAGIRVMILTATMIQEDPNNPLNTKLIPYNEFLRQLAADKKCLLADLNAAMQEQVKPAHKGNLLTVDGVHMNFAGNQMMATGVLKAFGLDDAAMAKAREPWMDIAGVEQVTCNLSLSVRELDTLNKMAGKHGTTLQKELDEALAKAKADLLSDKTVDKQE